MLTLRIIKWTLLFSAIPMDFVEPLNILGIFQHPRFSHFQFFQAVTRGLAIAGHNLTVISHFSQKNPISGYRDLPLTGMDTQFNGIDIKLKAPTFYDHLLEFSLLYSFAKEACNLTLNSPALAQVLDENFHYDVILMEQFNTDCLMGVAYVLKAPVVALISSAMMPWLYERFGSPFITSHMPVLYMAYSEDMSFFQRLNNWFNFHVLRVLYHYFSIPAADAMVRARFGNYIPAVSELIKNSSLILVNTHFSLSGVRPISPEIIEVGGVHIELSKPLPHGLQNWLDKAENGAIVISWGSMIRAESLPVEKRNALLDALELLEQKVVWKWENDTMPNKPENVLISKWLPQRDVLCHPNVKVFMTHGELMGVSEAVQCGVPTVVTPINGDQFLNAAALVHRGMGIVLPYSDMTKANILRALKTVLLKRYMVHAKKVSYSFKNRPMSALQTSIWWVEYAAKTNGAPLLKSSASELSSWAYYCWDIYLFLLLICAFVITIFFLFLSKICTSSQKGTKKLN